ncbi:hypothetical protein HYV11_00785 [Candidatus Dependentiae bacterium]|nr:hypothetical protein [Candidatus Dependentiae bacterium]
MNQFMKLCLLHFLLSKVIFCPEAMVSFDHMKSLGSIDTLPTHNEVIERQQKVDKYKELQQRHSIEQKNLEAKYNEKRKSLEKKSQTLVDPKSLKRVPYSEKLRLKYLADLEKEYKQEKRTLVDKQDDEYISARETRDQQNQTERKLADELKEELDKSLSRQKKTKSALFSKTSLADQLNSTHDYGRKIDSIRQDYEEKKDMLMRKYNNRKDKIISKMNSYFTSEAEKDRLSNELKKVTQEYEKESQVLAEKQSEEIFNQMKLRDEKLQELEKDTIQQTMLERLSLSKDQSNQLPSVIESISKKAKTDPQIFTQKLAEDLTRQLDLTKEQQESLNSGGFFEFLIQLFKQFANVKNIK